MKTDWKWAAIAVIVWTNFPTEVHARCYEPKFPPCMHDSDGCPGEIDCVGRLPDEVHERRSRMPVAEHPG